MRNRGAAGLMVAALLLLGTGSAQAADCRGDVVRFRPSQSAIKLTDGGIALYSQMRVNVDGMSRAYHRDNVAGGGLINLCNGGRPHPAGRPDYNASENNEACRRFAEDYTAIRAAGWKDPGVGAIHWFGILGLDSVRIDGKLVENVVPVEQPDGSGFFVSPTSLIDPAFPVTDQRRYIDAESIAAAVIRGGSAMRDLGVKLGTFGVAMRRDKRIAAPFIVGDFGPRIGEGSYALAWAAKGGAIPRPATRQSVFAGDVGRPDVLWIFFADSPMPPPYRPESVAAAADAAFAAWGGQARLDACLADPAIPGR